MGLHFAIVQEYVPLYRKALFDELARLARAEGDEVTVYAGRPSAMQAGRNDAVTDASWLRSIKQHEFRILHRRATVRLLPRSVWRADLIVVEQARRNLDLPILLLWPRSRRKTGLWGHGADHVTVPSRFDRFVSRALLRRAAWLFAYTPKGAVAAARTGMDTTRTTVVYNSVDSSTLRRDMASIPMSESRPPARAAFIGGLDSSKRIEELIQIGEAAHAMEPRFRLTVAGDGVLRSTVTAAAARFAWFDFVGPVSGPAKAELLVRSDLLLLPGRVGLAAVDSLVAGRPIVTLADSTHAPEFEYLVPGETCFVAGSVSGAAKTVVHLLRDRRALEVAQDRCRAASEQYSIEKTARYFHRGLHQAVGRRS